MLKEILETMDWSDDGQLVFFDIQKLMNEINKKINSGKLDARSYQSLEKAKEELEKVLRRL